MIIKGYLCLNGAQTVGWGDTGAFLLKGDPPYVSNLINTTIITAPPVSGADRVLQESGDAILLESGDAILME